MRNERRHPARPRRSIRQLATHRHPPRRVEAIQLDAYLADIERELIRRSLDVAKGNRAQAARLLGVSRGRLLRRIESLRLGGEQDVRDRDL